MLETDRRKLLGAFVRAHRERLRPEGSGRRRTPGLRREELAARAGISPTWCAWIEQGRAVQASPEALGRLALALALTPPERAYLFELAGRIDAVGSASSEAGEPPASLQAAVRATAFPAYALDPLWNACCWNDAAATLFRGWLDGRTERNLLRFVFLDPAARTLIPEWEERSRRLLAEFRADYGHTFRDTGVHVLIDALARESSFFSEAWKAQDVMHRAGGRRVFLHPELGTLRYVQHSFSPSERPDHKLVLLVPEEGG